MSAYLFPLLHSVLFLFFFNDTATTEIYTLSLHDALPILRRDAGQHRRRRVREGPRAVRHGSRRRGRRRHGPLAGSGRSEEHTSELQSHSDLVCRLLLEKKKKKQKKTQSTSDQP